MYDPGGVPCPPIIYHIDKGQIARGDCSCRNRDVHVTRTSTVDTYVREASEVFSACNLSSFWDGKGDVCFLILTCHLRC